MDKMTALRSFGRPSYTPAKHARIMANRWYMVTFQNTESDPLTDYHGLADGEHVLLLPGKEARAARDARLNHCNGITEYDGHVFAASYVPVGSTERRPCGWYSERGEAAAAYKVLTDERDSMVQRCILSAKYHESINTPERVIAKAKKSGIGIACINNSAWIQKEIEQAKRWAAQTREAAKRYAAHNLDFRIGLIR